MDKMPDKEIKWINWIEQAVRKGLLYHIFFWVVFYLFIIIIDNSDTSLAYKVVNKGAKLIFYISIVYINISWLFPKYLRQKQQMVVYVSSLLLAIALLTPLEMIMSYLSMGNFDIRLSSVFTLSNYAKYFLGSFFVAFSSTLFKIINDWVEHQREREDLRRQNLQSELKFLKAQINPHFFFNTLNSLYALTLVKSDKAPEIVLKLSEMMRYMLYESNERFIPLDKEINYMHNYLELEKLRHGDRVAVEFNQWGNPEGHQIAPLLFITFLENSFKHGLDNTLDKGFVYINFTISDDQITIEVRNSIPKQAPKANTPNKKVGGIGLKNVKRRLKILYPNRHTLFIAKENDEFIVELILKGTKYSSPIAIKPPKVKASS